MQRFMNLRGFASYDDLYDWSVNDSAQFWEALCDFCDVKFSTPPTETLARQSFQRFFRLFKRLSGMSGTAKEGASEFWKIYQLPVMQNRPTNPVSASITRNWFFAHRKTSGRQYLKKSCRCSAQEVPAAPAPTTTVLTVNTGMRWSPMVHSVLVTV